MNLLTLKLLKLKRFLAQRPWKKYMLWSFYAFGIVTLISILFLLSLRWVNPSVTAFTLQEDWETLNAERYSLRKYWVSYEDIPENIKWAVVASEDQYFWKHWGLDLAAIEDAWEENQRGSRTRGASTISQQVAKNLFLWSGKSYFRKGMEAGLTVGIELLWTKERILEVYLNIAEFGPGIYGIGKASEHFFEKPAGELLAEESARMAAVLPNPKRMRVEPPSPYVNERKDWILRNMMNLSGIAYYTPPSATFNGVPVDSIDIFQIPTIPRIQIRTFQISEPDTGSVIASVSSDTTDIRL